MSTLMIDEPATPDEALSDGKSVAKRSWLVRCVDLFDRPCEITITAYLDRAPRVGITSPAGEFAVLGVPEIPALSHALAEAHTFLRAGKC